MILSACYVVWVHSVYLSFSGELVQGDGTPVRVGVTGRNGCCGCGTEAGEEAWWETGTKQLQDPGELQMPRGLPRTYVGDAAGRDALPCVQHQDSLQGHPAEEVVALGTDTSRVGTGVHSPRQKYVPPSWHNRGSAQFICFSFIHAGTRVILICLPLSQKQSPKSAP